MYLGKTAKQHYQEKVAWKARSDKHYKAYMGLKKIIDAIRKAVA